MAEQTLKIRLIEIIKICNYLLLFIYTLNFQYF